MKPAAAIDLERCAMLATAIAELAKLDLDDESAEWLLLLIRETCIGIRDRLDCELRRRGEVGLGYLDPIRAELDERRAEIPKLKAAS